MHSSTCKELFSLMSQFVQALSSAQKLLYLTLTVNKAYLPLNWKYINYIHHLSQLNFFHPVSSFRRTLYFSVCFMLVRMILLHTISQCNTEARMSRGIIERKGCPKVGLLLETVSPGNSL